VEFREPLRWQGRNDVGFSHCFVVDSSSTNFQTITAVSN
jgi:hypothetical protein